MGARTSVYLDDSLQAAVKASGVPLAELIRRGLETAKPATRVADSTDQTGTPHADSEAAASPLTLPPGEPCPGVACSGPGCWNRDTARYGLRHLVLCTACAAALQGHVHQRQLPESAARAIRRGAA